MPSPPSWTSRYRQLGLPVTTESGYGWEGMLGGIVGRMDGRLERDTRPLELVTRPAALALLFLLNIGDVITTRRVLAMGGQEGNPLASQLLTHSLNTLLLVKLALVIGIAVATLLAPARHAVRSARWVWFAVLVYGLVVIWNCGQILAYRLG